MVLATHYGFSADHAIRNGRMRNPARWSTGWGRCRDPISGIPRSLTWLAHRRGDVACERLDAGAGGGRVAVNRSVVKRAQGKSGAQVSDFADVRGPFTASPRGRQETAQRRGGAGKVARPLPGKSGAKTSPHASWRAALSPVRGGARVASCRCSNTSSSDLDRIGLALIICAIRFQEISRATRVSDYSCRARLFFGLLIGWRLSIFYTWIKGAAHFASRGE